MNQLHSFAVASHASAVLRASTDWFSRAELLDAGDLIDVSDIAREAGFRVPVAVTRAVWVDCIERGEADSMLHQDQEQSERLWAVMWGARSQIKNVPRQSSTFFDLSVSADGQGVKPRLVTLKLIVNPGDEGQPVLTILRRDED